MERTRALTFIVTLAFLVPVLPAQVALGHGVELSSSIREGVEISAAFEGGGPMAEAQVSVFAPGEPVEPWLRGSTDEDGRFFFVPDYERPGTWEVQVRQAGHGGIVRVEIDSEGAVQTTAGGLTALQRALMAACVIWGSIGTALYFRRRAA